MTARTAAPAGIQERLALRPGVYLVRDADGRHHLVADQDVEPLGRPSPAVLTALRGLAAEAGGDGDAPPVPPPAAEPSAMDLSMDLSAVESLTMGMSAADGPVAGVPATGGPAVVLDGGGNGAAPDGAGAGALLARLRARGWLAITVLHHGRPLYTMVPECCPPAGPPPAEPASGAVLSRFTLIRRVDDRLVMESPRAWCTVGVHDPTILAEVATGYPAPGCGGHPWAAPEVSARLRRDLRWAELLAPRRGAEGTELRLRQWSPHELWFHHRSRAARPGRGFGGTGWARGTFPPPPAAHEPFGGAAVELRRPDLAALRASDVPLTTALEERRSIRTHDDAAPLTGDELGELLYRCARDRKQWTAGGMEHLSRPYPSGGGLYELEIYPVVRHVAGIDPGLYHYQSARHRLVRVAPPGPAVGRLLRTAMRASRSAQVPQVVLVVAARFGRLMWKYEEMAYALILKDVGALYQTMYLVATAMGLAPCGLGAGDPVAFTRATGLDPLAEGSVGEFLLGSRGYVEEDAAS